MQSGVFWGYVGLVRGICDQIRGEYARPMRVIGTGGLAPLLAQGDGLFDVIEDDLTIHGLTVIQQFNTGWDAQ
jgi:type III pantothenate kinase